jgi:penicillin-insensitive murein endopeptidase
MKRIIGAACAALLCLTAPASAEQLANRLFGAMATASDQRPEAIGSYARGCGAGMVQLPETGPSWQAMRLSRNRNWGQPELVRFIVDLSQAAQAIGWRGLYVGDMSQPRGGPMTSGHASHQIGLDADIWMLPPSSLRLSAGAREGLSSISVRTDDQTRVNGNWTDSHLALIRAAASDARVDRVFVAAAVKIAMCNVAGRKDRAWLQKVRPIAGHNYHFHVRLKCPAGSAACKTQSPTVAELSKGGDGCDETLNWWVTDYLEQLRNPPKATKPTGPRPRTPREFTMADLPRQCAAVLSD